MATTPNRNLPLPAGTELVTLGDDALRDLSTKLDSAATLLTGTFTARPATAPVGTFYWASDSKALYVFVGSWTEVSVSPPIGAVSAFVGAGAPADPRFLVCDGSAVSRTTYATLYTVLGGANSPFGQGDGSTTFNLPDLRGRTVVGQGQGAGLTNRATGEKGGAESVALTTAQMPSHGHSVSDPGHGHVVRDPGHSHTFDRPAYRTAQYGIDPDHVTHTGQNFQTLNAYTGIWLENSGTGVTIQSNGSGQAHSNMQPYAAARFIVRAL